MKPQTRTPILLLAAAFACGLSSSVQAQPSLNFKRIVNNWPTIEVYFTASCDGLPLWKLTPEKIRILENGVEVAGADLWCPDPIIHCQMSIALVLDAGGSMRGEGNAMAIADGAAIVAMMDGSIDEATVLWFNDSASVEQPMTTKRELLHAAASPLPAYGFSALWDALYKGTEELIDNSSNPCRAVIVLTNGRDKSSSRSVQDCITLANRNRIRVFTIGLGTDIQSDDLIRISDLSGGKYYETPNPEQLAAIVQEIGSIIISDGGECIATYQARCMDGGVRTVNLTVLNICPDLQDTKTKTYKAPKDTSTFLPLRLRLATVKRHENADMAVPIELPDALEAGSFSSARFSLRFDTSRLRVMGFDAAPGELLEGVPVAMTRSGDTVTFRSSVSNIIGAPRSSAILGEIHFEAANPANPDTLRCLLEFINWTFDAGCLRPLLENGELTVLPLGPILSCAIGAPQSLSWNAVAKAYEPSPFAVRLTIANSGKSPAERPRYIIEYNATDFSLFHPYPDTVFSSLNEIPTGGSDSTTWRLVAKPRRSSDTCLLSVTALFDDHAPVHCAAGIFVPKQSAYAECSISIPGIAVRDSTQTYEPMPFPVTVLVTNAGTASTDTVRARLVLPQGLDYAFPDSSSSAEKIVTPALVPAGGQAQAQWLVRLPPSDVEREYSISCSTRNGELPQGVCSAALRIPKLRLLPSPQISANGLLVFCAGDSVSLDAGSRYATYSWNTGAATRTITIFTGGDYWVNVTDSAGRSGTSQPVLVIVYTPPAPRFSPAGVLDICEDDTLALDAGPGYASYLWNTGETSQILRIAKNGVSSVALRTFEGCDGGSDTVRTMLRPRPPIPTIQRSIDTLSTQAAFAFQWYVNGVAISGARDRTWIAVETGQYTVAAINEYGCASLSAAFDVGTLPVSIVRQARTWSLDIFPDPAANSITVSIGGGSMDPIAIALLDASGRAIVASCELGGASSSSATIRLDDQPAGIYFITARRGEETRVRKFVKLP